MSLQYTLEKLIRFKTVTGDAAAVQASYEWIKDQVSVAPLYIKEHVHDGYKTLVMTTRRTRSPKVWLAAHVDVVAGSAALFKPVVRDGRLIGRGAYDMKFAIACYVELLQELAAEARKYDIGVIIVSDEEVRGGSMGKVLKDLRLSGEVAFLPDGGGEWQFEEAAKGVYSLVMRAHGQSAHGSRPWHGESAIMKLHAFITDVTQAMAEFATDDPLHWYPTLNIGRISGGEAWNQVAETAEATFDIRYTRASERKAIERMLARLGKRHPGIALETKIEVEPISVGRGKDQAKAFIRIAKELYGIKVGWKKSYGGSDAEFLHKNNIPTLLIWPKAGGAHSEHEWIDLADLERYYEVLKAWVKEIAQR